MPLRGFSSSDVKTKKRCDKEFLSNRERIDFLADLIEEGSEDPVIYELSRRILVAKNVKSYDAEGEVKALFLWVRDNIRYTNHVMCRDSFQTARRTIDLKAGDCDQATVVLSAMFLSVGIPTAMRIITTDRSKPFHHIYSLAGLPKNNPSKWIPLDTINKSARVGWEPDFVDHRDYKVVCK